MTLNAPDLKTHGVLYVDDELQAGKYFKKGLDADFRVLTAANVAEAMTILEREASTIGVVITDQRMPGQPGVNLLAQVRQRWPAIVRILITAFSDLESAVAAVNVGNVYKYVTKPANFLLLRQTLTEALALYQQTIERDALATTLRALEEQRAATQAAEAQREHLQERLIAASRQAGRAEVATGILHNVGNVLNSVNVAAAMIHRTLEQSKVGNLCKALAMLEEHNADLANFLASDERGQRLPSYLSKLGHVLVEEHATIATEIASLGRNLEHIVQVVQMQQSYAKESTIRQMVDPADILDDALRVNLVASGQRDVELVREIAEVPSVSLDKHKVLQILINLLSNANNAVKTRGPGEKRITLRTETFERSARPFIRFQVIDSGHGILPENLTRIFTHGFTTRTDGHGFGLHSSANAAREMGGSLTVSSGGLDQGATFTLELPTDEESAVSPVSSELTQKVAA